MSKRNSKVDSATAAVISLAKDVDPSESVVTLSSGIKARIMPVAAGLIEEAHSSIRTPHPPMWFNEEKGREEENPNDPRYLEELEAVERRRNKASMDAMVMFGIQLLDDEGNSVGAPEHDDWLTGIKFMERRGLISLDGLDLEDPIDREFLYKKLVVVSAKDIALVGKKSGFTEEDVVRAAESFRSDS